MHLMLLDQPVENMAELHPEQRPYPGDGGCHDLELVCVSWMIGPCFQFPGAFDPAVSVARCAEWFLNVYFVGVDPNDWPWGLLGY
jgi:hypothetical protein